MDNPESKVRIILYTKPGCHLCEEMKAEMNRAGCAELFTLLETNIESDPELYARYRYDIPVLTINDVEVFRHRLSAAEFKSYVNRFSAGGAARS